MSHPLRSLRLRPSRSPISAALVSFALAAAGVSVLTGSATAVTVSELDLSWVGGPASVGNGEPLQGVAHVNLNDHLGADGETANRVVEFAATGGIFTRLPSACRTDGDPVSAVATNGAAVRCNLGRVRMGTAMEIDFAVSAHGDDGGSVTVELTDGMTTASLPPIPITAQQGIDVVFNEAQRVQANQAWQAAFPIAVAQPVGAMDLRGPISFDVVISNRTSTNAPTAITPSQARCVPLSSSSPPSSMPSTSSQAPVPTTCTITLSSPGLLHVVLDGYRTPAGIDAPTAAADGARLPTDRRYFAAFALPLQAVSGLTPASSSFDLTVTHVAARTTTGTAVTEVDTTNNSETAAVTVAGGYAHNWSHPAASAPPMDSRVVGGGGAWAASYYATANDQIVTSSSNGVWASTPIAAITAGAEWTTCEILDGPASFTGSVIPNMQPGSLPDLAPLPADSFQWSVSTAPLPPSGTRGGLDCGKLPFAPVSYAVINHSGDACTCTEEQRLVVADPATITAIKLSVDPAKLAAAMPLATTPVRVGMHAAARIAAAATPAEAVWTLGSVVDRSGAWRSSNESPSSITTTPGLAYPGTNSFRDVMRILGSRPYVRKDVSQPDVRAGDVVTYALRTGAEANLGAGSASWTITDDVPAGIEFIGGSASVAPASVIQRPDGTTRLTWSMAGPVNTESEITYRGRIAFTSGVRRNTAVASITARSTAGSPEVLTSQDSADVAYAADGRTLLTKSAGSATFAAGGSNTWILGLHNLDTVDQAQTDLIDVLPWNGDARGSAFHGRYRIESVSSADGESVYYSTLPPGSISTDPNDSSNGAFASPSPIWSRTMPSDPSAVTAIRVVGGTLAVGAARTTTIRWRPTGGRSGDRFENIAYATATHTRLQMIKGAAASTVTDGSHLQIAKQFVSADGWADGDALHYRVTVHNPSTTVAHQVTVHDVGGNGNDPASAQFDHPEVGSFDPATRAWSIGDLAAGQTVTADLTTTITAGVDRTKSLDNLVYVENPSNPYLPSPSHTCQRNNEDVHSDVDQCDVASVSPPRLRIDKRVDSASGDGVIVWSVHVRVDGTVSAHDVSVQDTYPPGLDPSSVRVSRAPSRGSFDPTTGRWRIGELEPGAVASVTFQAQVVAPVGTRIVNTARVDSPDVVPPAPVPDTPCQANDGPTIDAALDADTDQCDAVETVHGPPRQAPRPAPGPDQLPETGGPSLWFGVTGAASAVSAAALSLGGRRRRAAAPAHRARS